MKRCGGDEPCYLEMFVLVGAGALHVFTELATSATVSRIYNFLACLVFLTYVVWRLGRNPNLRRAWGLRGDNFASALRVQATLVAPAIALMFVAGWFLGHRVCPPTFWVALVGYLGWGVIQQFALQNLLARNLKRLIPNQPAWVLVSALVFSLSHTPRFELVALTFVAGLLLTLGHQRQPNIWATGIAHGLLGAIAFYAVLGEDPGARILRVLSGGDR